MTTGPTEAEADGPVQSGRGSFCLEKRILDALEMAKSERDIHAFLKHNDRLVRHAFNAWAWNYTAVQSEFRLGSDYRPDFLVLSANSGQWFSTFIELKSHRARPFNVNGRPGRDLNAALAQLQDWALWLREHEAEFRTSLSRFFEAESVPAMCSNASLHTHAATEIRDARTYLTFRHFAVIGRRDLIPADHQRRRHLYIKQDIEIATYDRIVDVARRLE